MISWYHVTWVKVCQGDCIVVELLMLPLTLGTVQYTVRLLGPELTAIFSGYRSSEGFGTVWECEGEEWMEGREEG